MPSPESLDTSETIIQTFQSSIEKLDVAERFSAVEDISDVDDSAQTLLDSLSTARREALRAYATIPISVPTEFIEQDSKCAASIDEAANHAKAKLIVANPFLVKSILKLLFFQPDGTVNPNEKQLMDLITKNQI